MRKHLKIALLIAGLTLAVPLYAQDVTPEITPETTTEIVPIVLEPITDEAFDIQAVVPVGWTPLGNGLYARSDLNTDVTLIALQAAPFGAEEVLQALLPQLALTEAPESAGDYPTEVFTWTLYRVDVPAGAETIRTDFGLAEQQGVTYIAFLQSSINEADGLYNSVFIPILDAYAPLAPAETSYTSEAVTFINEENGITLAGTLTLPEGEAPFTAVVLSSGSGPQDRDEQIAGTAMRPFRLIADGLTRAGYAVLRYDDRGVGESEGDYAAATITDFTSDARAALAYLRARAEIDPARTGILGHSEGGIYAAILGAEDPNLAFVISMAGTAVNGYDLLLTQNEAIWRSVGRTEGAIDNQIALLNEIFPLIIEGDYEAVRPLVEAQIRIEVENATDEEIQQIGEPEAFITQQTDATVQTYANAWMGELLTLNPADYWAQTTAPVLAIFGGKDIQVDAEINATSIEAAFNAGGNEDVTIITLPEANHLFQDADTGGLEEYGTLPAEFDPAFIPTIVEWLDARFAQPE